MKNQSLRVVALIWAAVMIAVISSTATLLISGRAANPQPENARLVTEEEYAAIERYSRLDEVRALLEAEYYQELDDDALMLGAIRGMASSVGDPYTFYYTPEELTRSNENDAGFYRGIGTLLQRTDDGRLQVIKVYPNAPAEAAGLRVGDIILAVDGETVDALDGRAYSEAVSRIRGADGTTALLTVQRDGETLEIPVVRGDVSISYADYRVLPGNIGYISISQFTGDAASVFQEAVASFKEQGVSGLVIDLRNNPGGLLDQVVSIADTLLPTGVIVYVKDRDGTRHDFYSDEDFYDVPLSVLVNGMSASASEILAGAVQAFDRGKVVGLTTYGKGIVQSLHTFPEDSAGIQYTTSSYYDANDRCPQGVGIAPDVEVALVGGSIPPQPDPDSDNQLAAAIEALGL